MTREYRKKEETKNGKGMQKWTIEAKNTQIYDT
jgi:hypothetical protein